MSLIGIKQYLIQVDLQVVVREDHEAEEDPRLVVRVTCSLYKDGKPLSS